MNNSLVQHIRMFHFATRLPVFHYTADEVTTLPSAIPRACELLEEPLPLLRELQLDQAPVQELFFRNSAFGEQYFCFRQSAAWTLACGPYLHISFQDKDVAQLIRSLHLRLEHKDALSRHFEALPRLSESSIYYAGALLRYLVTNTEDSLADSQDSLVQPASAHLYEQTAYQHRMSMFHHPPYFFEQEISRQIAAANRDNALQLLHELRSLERAKLADTPLRSLKNSMVAFVTLITRAAIDGGVPYQDAFILSDGFIQLIERQQDIAILETIQEAIVNRFIDQVAQVQLQHYSKPIRQVLAYIDDYLTEELNARVLGEMIYMNPDYLAALFNREVGETLHQHILRRRIEEAARFMRYSGESISTIASFYRFSSQSHFTAVFKKHMGMTPSKYRNL